MIVLIVLILGWVLADDLAQRANTLRTEHKQLSAEIAKLQSLSRNTSLQSEVAAAAQRSDRLRLAAYAGPSLSVARAQLSNDLQRVVASQASAGALFRLSKATSTEAAKPGVTSPLPEGFHQESFAISGPFAPALIMRVLQDLAASPRLLRIDGMSVKGSRFELFGSAVLHVVSPTAQGTTP